MGTLLAALDPCSGDVVSIDDSLTSEHIDDGINDQEEIMPAPNEVVDTANHDEAIQIGDGADGKHTNKLFTVLRKSERLYKKFSTGVLHA